MPFISHLEETLAETDVLELQDEECRIILYNDDYNTFDYVIDILVRCAVILLNRPSNVLLSFISKGNAM